MALRAATSFHEYTPRPEYDAFSKQVDIKFKGTTKDRFSQMVKKIEKLKSQSIRQPKKVKTSG